MMKNTALEAENVRAPPHTVQPARPHAPLQASTVNKLNLPDKAMDWFVDPKLQDLRNCERKRMATIER